MIQAAARGARGAEDIGAFPKVTTKPRRWLSRLHEGTRRLAVGAARSRALSSPGDAGGTRRCASVPPRDRHPARRRMLARPLLSRRRFRLAASSATAPRSPGSVGRSTESRARRPISPSSRSSSSSAGRRSSGSDRSSSTSGSAKSTGGAFASNRPCWARSRSSVSWPLSSRRKASKPRAVDQAHPHLGRDRRAREQAAGRRSGSGPAKATTCSSRVPPAFLASFGERDCSGDARAARCRMP